MKVKNNTFFLKLLIQSIAGVFIIFIISFTISNNIIKNNYITNLKKELLSNIKLVAQLTKNNLNNKDYLKINKQINELRNILSNLRITIIDQNGIVIADSNEDFGKMENHSNRDEFIDARNGITSSYIRKSSTLNTDMLYLAIPVYNNENVLYIYRSSVMISEMKIVITNLRNKMTAIGIFFILVSGIYFFLISKKISEPIELLSEASKKVAEGDFDTTLFIDKRNYEMKILIANFNEMTEKLKKYFKELENEKEELQSIISSMEEGVLVIDNSGKIIKTNQSFLKIVNDDSVINKYYWEVLRDSDITSFIKNMEKYKNGFVKEIKFSDKILLCSMNALLTNKGFVFVFYDITNIKNLEKIKKDFTSNVSHELRTPLTAIKGFTETLLEVEDKTDKKKFLDIILRNTDRLINIVNDLLALSKGEYERPELLVFDEINLDTVFKNIFFIFEHNVEKKGIKLVYENKSGILKFKTELNIFEQIFINLIDNAVKYTDKGDIKVIISPADKKLKIEISDTGIGIPESELNRIFERFYVVDKSRSKNTGGTGLGLAIVKHDIELLSGSISVQSVLGKGTTFQIIF